MRSVPFALLRGSSVMRRSRARSVTEPCNPCAGPVANGAQAFYAQVLDLLRDARVRFMVGGAYGFERYTGIKRHSRDFDIFVLREELERVLEIGAAHGFETEFTHPHWLGKIRKDDCYVDVIFSS